MFDISGRSVTVRPWRDGDPGKGAIVVSGQDLADCVLLVLNDQNVVTWRDEALSPAVFYAYRRVADAALYALLTDDKDVDGYCTRLSARAREDAAGRSTNTTQGGSNE